MGAGEAAGRPRSEIQSLEETGAIANAPQSGKWRLTMPLDSLVSRGRMSICDPDHTYKLGIP